MSKMTKKMPVERFRAGQVSCALWENEIEVAGERRTILKATVSRRYKDANGDWQSSESFSRNEIPLVIYCLVKAFVAIVERPKEDEAPKEEVVI